MKHTASQKFGVSDEENLQKVGFRHSKFEIFRFLLMKIWKLGFIQKSPLLKSKGKKLFCSHWGSLKKLENFFDCLSPGATSVKACLLRLKWYENMKKRSTNLILNVAHPNTKLRAVYTALTRPYCKGTENLCSCTYVSAVYTKFWSPPNWNLTGNHQYDQIWYMKCIWYLASCWGQSELLCSWVQCGFHKPNCNPIFWIANKKA